MADGGNMNGYKTYTVVAGVILVAIGGFLSGDLSVQEAVNQILLGLGIAGLRHGVSKG